MPYVNIGGVWKKSTNTSVNIGGVWKQQNIPYVNIGGVWKRDNSNNLFYVGYDSSKGDRSYYPIKYITTGSTTKIEVDLYALSKWSPASMYLQILPYYLISGGSYLHYDITFTPSVSGTFKISTDIGNTYFTESEGYRLTSSLVGDAYVPYFNGLETLPTFSQNTSYTYSNVLSMGNLNSRCLTPFIRFYTQSGCKTSGDKITVEFRKLKTVHYSGTEYNYLV